MATNPQVPVPNGREMEFFRQCEILAGLHGCRALFGTGIFGAVGVRSPLFEAATVQLLILLNDLVRKADKDKKRITSTEHVDLMEGVADVTDLISVCRNVACHMTSKSQDFNTNRFRFLACVGKSAAPAVVMDDVVRMGCEFDDDIAVYYGPYRFYIQRHGMATLEKLDALYKDVFPGRFGGMPGIDGK